MIIQNTLWIFTLWFHAKLSHSTQQHNTMSSEVRQRKNAPKKKQRTDNSIQCPPKTVKTAGFKFWEICTTRNIVLMLIILLITYYRIKSKPSMFSESDENERSTIPEMIRKRKVLPSTPVLNQYYHRQIITSSDTAQEYFDQAMVLSAGFNHDEAIRSLQYALTFDEQCVMCHWAIAYNYGMNINRVNDEKRLSISVKHANLAKQYSAKVQQDQVHQDLVDAMYVLHVIIYIKQCVHTRFVFVSECCDSHKEEL